MREAFIDGYTCPNCGAPVTTEICEFCGASTAIASKNTDMKYPAIECIETDVDSKGIWQVLIMGIVFLGFGVVFPLIIFKFCDWHNMDGIRFMYFASLLFGVIGIFFIFDSIRLIYRFVLTFLLGKQIHGYIWGYMDNKRCDGVIHGGIADRNGGQIAKILIKGDNTPAFLLYELKHDEQPYGINQKVSLKKLGKWYLLVGLADEKA